MGGDDVFRLSYPSEGIVTVQAEDSEAHLLVAVFLRDPIMNLAEAAIQLLQGVVTEIKLEWFSEPGVYQWVLKRTGERLSIQIIYFRAGVSASGPREVVFSADCRLVEFTGQVLSVVDRVVRESSHGGQWPNVSHQRLTSLGERAERLRSLQRSRRTLR